MKKKHLTEAEYIAIGKRLCDMGDEILALRNELSRAHRLDSKVLTCAESVRRKLVDTRSALENECAARHGDNAALRTFVGGRRS